MATTYRAIIIERLLFYILLVAISNNHNPDSQRSYLSFLNFLVCSKLMSFALYFVFSYISFFLVLLFVENVKL